MEKAFEIARSLASEGVELYYNDYNEAAQGKRDAIFSMLEPVIAAGNIDGIGFQAHMGFSDTPYGYNASVSDLRATMKKYTDLGLKVKITELDVCVTANSAGQQAARYKELFQLFYEEKEHIASVSVWGVIDSDSWRSSYTPLLFDSSYTAKAAYYGALEPVAGPTPTATPTPTPTATPVPSVPNPAPVQTERPEPSVPIIIVPSKPEIDFDSMPPEKVPSEWAKPEIIKAIETQLLPEALQEDYTKPVTREEFCELAVAFIESISGSAIETYLESFGITADFGVFNDTANKNIVFTAALGIVNGKGNGRFDPAGTIKREEAAAMLYRMATALGFSTAADDPLSFPDADEFSDYSRDAIAFVSSCVDPGSGLRVMGGLASGGFSPSGMYTREQSAATMVRLFNLLF